MKRLAYLLIFGTTVHLNARAQTPTQTPTGANLYVNYCSGCHGQQLEGGRASILIKDVWAYGNDRDSITKTIRNGIPNTEMPKWSDVLTEQQMTAIADCIVKAQKKPTTPKGKRKPQ